MCACWGTLRLVTSASRPRFPSRKASATVTLVCRLKRLDCVPVPILPPPPAWLSFRYSVTATPFPFSPPPQLAPYCSPFSGRSSVAIKKPTTVMPVFLAVGHATLAHPLATPHQRHLPPPFNPAIGHRFVHRHRSGVQVHTLTSSVRLIHVTYQT